MNEGKCTRMNPARRVYSSSVSRMVDYSVSHSVMVSVETGTVTFFA